MLTHFLALMKYNLQDLLFFHPRCPEWILAAASQGSHLMDTILCDLPFVTTYLDGVLIHSPSIEEHESHLKVVFDRVQSAWLTLHSGKCNIGACQVRYLGHVFFARGIKPDPLKFPQIPSDLRHFLGLTL